jgi:archaellum component FlaC
MDKYTRGQINEMRVKMKYLTNYDTSKTPKDNQMIEEGVTTATITWKLEQDMPQMDKYHNEPAMFVDVVKQIHDGKHLNQKGINEFKLGYDALTKYASELIKKDETIKDAYGEDISTKELGELILIELDRGLEGTVFRSGAGILRGYFGRRRAESMKWIEDYLNTLPKELQPEKTMYAFSKYDEDKVSQAEREARNEGALAINEANVADMSNNLKKLTDQLAAAYGYMMGTNRDYQPAGDIEREIAGIKNDIEKLEKEIQHEVSGRIAVNENIQDISRISGAEIDRSKMDKGYLTDLVTIIDEFGGNVIPFWTKILLPTLMKHRGKVSWDRLPVVLLKTLDHNTAQAVVDELWDRYEATVPANERKPRAGSEGPPEEVEDEDERGYRIEPVNLQGDQGITTGSR